MNNAKGSMKNKRKQLMYYLTLQDKKEVIKETNTTALFLYDFWVSKLAHENYDFSDSKASTALDIPITSVRDLRLMLTKHHYFVQLSGKVGGQKATQTYLGKRAVAEGTVIPAVFKLNTCKEVFDKYSYERKDFVESEILNHVNDTKWCAEILNMIYN